ncbi:hypothetical protein IGI04_023564 [Brassica rapa subsp. trilocularis]|uniref:Uncharacterized protein n=1 Tax=Brassica rapa subsp. trilocularis TaxID=1813537 RepID=A0ABQ7M477_BRACM|nr:hypothetical protein IGI04_023564 [Brassica rapa subsp. trilocularis]
MSSRLATAPPSLHVFPSICCTRVTVTRLLRVSGRHRSRSFNVGPSTPHRAHGLKLRPKASNRPDRDKHFDRFILLVAALHGINGMSLGPRPSDRAVRLLHVERSQAHETAMADLFLGTSGQIIPDKHSEVESKLDFVKRTLRARRSAGQVDI